MKTYGEILSWRTGSLEVEMRHGEMDVKYVKDGRWVGPHLLEGGRRVLGVRRVRVGI